MTPSTSSTGQDRAAPLTPDALAAIRERDAAPYQSASEAFRDRRALLAELDRRSGAALDVERLADILADPVVFGWLRDRDPEMHEFGPEYFRRKADRILAASPQDPEPGTERPVDYLAGKDRSMAEHSIDRSACPNCGEWRDNPTADCAACGYAGADR